MRRRHGTKAIDGRAPRLWIWAHPTNEIGCRVKLRPEAKPFVSSIFLSASRSSSLAQIAAFPVRLLVRAQNQCHHVPCDIAVRLARLACVDAVEKVLYLTREVQSLIAIHQN